METIFTPRLALRPFREADFAALFAMHQRPEVSRWLGNGEIPTAAQTRYRLALYRQPLVASGAILAITPREAADDATFYGTALLKPIPLSAGEAAETLFEVGWHLHPDYWHQGYATEAAAALLARAEAAGLPQVVAVTWPDNLRSQAVMRRLGMVRVGLSRRFYDAETLLFVRRFI